MKGEESRRELVSATPDDYSLRATEEVVNHFASD